MSTDLGAASFPGAAPDSYVTEIGYPEPDRGPLQVLRSPAAWPRPEVVAA